MALEKQLNSRIILKHDTEANWNLATNFIPKAGEMIIYDIDNNHSEQRIKIGDGTTTVTNLPFYLSSTEWKNFGPPPLPDLVDFEYVDNGDGTVTLTAWKGTLNGEPSTKLVIPDHPRIIL